MWEAIAVVALVIIIGSSAWAGWRAAPYLPTRRTDVDRLLRLAAVRADDVVYDLGAGDARLMLTAVKRFGCEAIGYEIGVLPWLTGWWRITRARQQQHAKLRFQDFYQANLSSATVVVCFLTPRAMPKLRMQLERQLRPGTRIVSYAFPIPGWTPVQVDKPSPQSLAIYLYHTPTEH